MMSREAACGERGRSKAGYSFSQGSLHNTSYHHIP